MAQEVAVGMRSTPKGISHDIVFSDEVGAPAGRGGLIKMSTDNGSPLS